MACRHNGDFGTPFFRGRQFLRGSRSTKLLRRTDGCILSLDCFASQVALTALLWCSWLGGLAVDGLIVVFCVSIVVVVVVVGSLAANKSLGKFFLEPHPFWYATTASLRNPTAQNFGEDFSTPLHSQSSPIHNHQPVSYVLHQAAFFRASFFRSLLLWFSSLPGFRQPFLRENTRKSHVFFSSSKKRNGGF